MALQFTGAIRYRLRPADVLAIQWTGDNADQLRGLAGQHFDTIDPEDRIEDPEETAAFRTHEHGGWLGLKSGDWVVKRGKELLKVGAADFAKLYEPVGVGAHKCQCGHSGLFHTAPEPHSCFSPSGCPCEGFASADPTV
jgi:hypothetical protein